MSLTSVQLAWTAARPGASQAPPRRARQVLRIELSSEEDAQFLHTLEVGEEEFQGLKAEQGILVDFGSFPGKVVSLLQKCAAERAAQPPRCPRPRARRPAWHSCLPSYRIPLDPWTSWAVRRSIAQTQVTLTRCHSPR